MNLVILSQQISRAFSQEELRLLGYTVGVDLENLPSATKEGLAHELVRYMVRVGRLGDLLIRCATERPLLTWPDAQGVEEPPAPAATTEGHPALPGIAPRDAHLSATVVRGICLIAAIIGSWPVIFGTHHRSLLAKVAMLTAVWVGTFGLGLIFRIWQHLEGGLIDFLTRRITNYFTPRLRHYRQHLVYRHRDFDVKGLATQGIFTLMLQDVFVDLRVAPKTPHDLSADPLQVPADLREGQHSVWDFLLAAPMTQQNLAIIGPPGSGKTTLLKHMALTLSDDATRARHKGPDKLPVLLFLRGHVDAICNSPSYTLPDAIARALCQESMPDPPPPAWFEEALLRGDCLVLLDGLDEVADPRRREAVARWVERQMEAFGQNRFVVSSRPFGYRSNPLSGVTVLEVQPLTWEQVSHFVERWYLANEVMSAQRDDAGVRMKAQEGAEDLLRRIRNTPALTRLAVNPLLLTMIATVHRYRSSLPGRRVELYAEICDVFLGKRQQARGLALDLTPAQKQRVLQPLAYHMMCHQRREIDRTEAEQVIAASLRLVDPRSEAGDFLKMIENSSGLLLERESGEYAFAHLTFQEYLAAAHVLEQDLKADLIAYVEDSWWHEAIRLYCARADATPIIRHCLRGERPSVPALTLAIECSEEAREVQPDTRQKLVSILEQGVEDPNPERRRLVAEALLALRLRRMRRVSDDLYVDDGLVTQAEYQLFLDDQLAQGAYHQPDHWLDPQFSAGRGREPVLGVRPSDAEAFCVWLSERDGEEWSFRLPSTGEHDLLPGRVGFWTTATDDESGDTSVYDFAISDALDGPGPKSHREEGLEEFTRPLNLDRARDRARNLAYDLTHDEELDRDLARARAHDLARALAHDLTHDRDLARDLAHDLARDLSPIFDRTPLSKEKKLHGMREARAVSLIISGILLKVKRQVTHNSLIQRWFANRRAEQLHREQLLDQQVDQYLELYLDLMTLEKRIEGNLPAIEGIRLVKARKHEETPYARNEW